MPVSGEWRRVRGLLVSLWIEGFEGIEEIDEIDEIDKGTRGQEEGRQGEGRWGEKATV